MSFLRNKNLIVGVCGGIAAYKAVYLVRSLKKQGANVRVVMTNSAKEFVTSLTFQAVSGHPVHDSLLDTEAEAAMGHIELARWADMIVIAPATANTIAELAAGNASQLLTAICLATRAPLLVAPAMNQQMWMQPATQQNIRTLIERRVRVLGPDSGEQACGETGAGRMIEPDDIVAALQELCSHSSLSGVRVVLTAGPTREAIDPVRYISNHSSGKMGYALAQAALEAGADVTLISGPCNQSSSDRIKRIDVMSATDMLEAVESMKDGIDIFIAVAAVADYRVEQVSQQKIKKTEDTLQITLVKNPDILATVAQYKQRPFCVGFAAETEQLEEHARSKLETKQLDMVIANDVSQPGQGFNSDNNAVVALWKNGKQQFEPTIKTRLAVELIALIAGHYQQTKTGKT